MSAGSLHQTDFSRLLKQTQQDMPLSEATVQVEEVSTQWPFERTQQPLANEAGDMLDGQNKRRSLVRTNTGSISRPFPSCFETNERSIADATKTG